MALDSTRNFANVQVAGLHTATDTSIPLVAGEGARLPNPGVGGDTAFNVTWWNATDFPDPSLDPNRERVRVTTRATDTLTIVRGQEGIAATPKNLAGKTYRMIISWGQLERDQLREFPLTTRGDIPVFGTAKTRLPVGADGQALLADSVQPLGVRWGTPPAGITAGWELIRTGTFTADTNITGLDGNADRLWMLVIRARHTAGFTSRFRFNNDAGSNYNRTIHWHGFNAGATSHTVSALANQPQIDLIAWSFLNQFSVVMISPISGQRRIVIFQSIEETDASNIHKNEGAGVWTNTTDNIITINIITGTITAGEFFLFRRR